MSSELIADPETDGEGGRPARRRSPRYRRPGPVTKWWVRLHRWAALSVGLLLVVEAVTGVVLLYGNDLAKIAHPERYTVTPSATPMSQLDALAMVLRTHPELRADGVSQHDGVYLVEGESTPRKSVDAFVDPGTGRINGIGWEQPWSVSLLVNIHDCGLSCQGLPGYQAWLNTELPGVFGAEATVGSYLISTLGVVMIFMAVSGSVAWWPGLRSLVAGFVVRRGRGCYRWNLDLHRVVGIIAVPALLMWGATGAAPHFHWIKQAYFAVLPGGDRAEAPDPPAGSGQMLTAEQAQTRALAAHPGAQPASLSFHHPERPGGSYVFRLSRGYDPYRYWTFPGNHYVEVDSHGGGIHDFAPDRPGAPLAERLWFDGYLNGIHLGSVVGGLPRMLWALFGLSPVVLATTGLTVWLTKSRSARNRRRAAKVGGRGDVEPADRDRGGVEAASR